MRIFFLLLITFSSIFSITFEEYLKQENRAFENYNKALDKEYDIYQKELEEFWEKPKLSTEKSWVSYAKDKKSRVDVDFEKNSFSVEVIAKDVKEAKKRLEKEIAQVLSKNTADVVATDTLQKKIALLKPDRDTVTSKVDAKPILTELFFTKKPNKEELKSFSQELLKNTQIEETKSKLDKEKVYRVKVKMPKNATLKHSQIYIKEIKKNANRFGLQEELILAIMHTESWFNPFAKSYIPAFGLMQIVPSSAGVDTYRFLYKKDAKPRASYLYNSKNNIEMGTSYLYILNNRYLRLIKNPQSRLYCTIAAYNTGTGNIAWAFTKSNNMKKAAYLINRLTPEEVYRYLLLNLRYDEPKQYLKKVRIRMKYYKVEYNL